MKKLFSLLVTCLLMLSVVPMVFADGEGASGDVDVIVDNPNHAPEIFTDATQRSWYPNDQNFHTAEKYGTSGTNAYLDAYYDLGARGDYVFTGETITYYVIIEDIDGEDDIESVILQKDIVGVGSCSEIANVNLPWNDLNPVLPGFGAVFDDGTDNYDDATMNTYKCVLVIQSSWTGAGEINVKATDKSATPVETTWSDFLTMNPALSVTFVGPVSFGGAQAGTTVTSNTVSLKNVGGDGVVMDMYIASDDYFTDSTNPLAICGVGNGIPFDAFAYYATKGSVDSGDNDGSESGLGASCAADADEYTEMPSHSGDIADMCRIINHLADGSFLTQGQSMSLTFQLDVPTPCEGSFTNGQFHFVGRVV